MINLPLDIMTVGFSPSGYMDKPNFAEWARTFLEEIGFGPDLKTMCTEDEWDARPFRLLTLDKHYSHMVLELGLFLRHKFVILFLIAHGSINGQPNDNGVNLDYVTTKQYETEKYTRGRTGHVKKEGFNAVLGKCPLTYCSNPLHAQIRHSNEI